MVKGNAHYFATGVEYPCPAPFNQERAKDSHPKDEYPQIHAATSWCWRVAVWCATTTVHHYGIVRVAHERQRDGELGQCVQASTPQI
ncbi:TPA: hypothetical protein JD850_RS22235 [Citrobacter freundii]|nr:hypothetical protein [Citrobacter freundii]